jgi:hypothetical protein
MQDLHSSGLHPSGMPGPCSKGPLLCLKRHPQVGPWDPHTCHPPQKGSQPTKETAQTGLHAKEVTLQQLRLEFYCSRTGEFFPPSLRNLLPGSLFDHPPLLPFFVSSFFSFPLFSLSFIFPSLSLFYPCLLVLLVLILLPR